MRCKSSASGYFRGLTISALPTTGSPIRMRAAARYWQRCSKRTARQVHYCGFNAGECSGWHALSCSAMTMENSGSWRGLLARQAAVGEGADLCAGQRPRRSLHPLAWLTGPGDDDQRSLRRDQVTEPGDGIAPGRVGSACRSRLSTTRSKACRQAAGGPRPTPRPSARQSPHRPRAVPHPRW